MKYLIIWYFYDDAFTKKNLVTFCFSYLCLNGQFVVFSSSIRLSWQQNFPFHSQPWEHLQVMNPLMVWKIELFLYVISWPKYLRSVRKSVKKMKCANVRYLVIPCECVNTLILNSIRYSLLILTCIVYFLLYIILIQLT